MVRGSVGEDMTGEGETCLVRGSVGETSLTWQSSSYIPLFKNLKMSHT